MTGDAPKAEQDANRTEGWPEGSVDSCLNWTADQHAQVAADLLDGACNLTYSEDGWDGNPPHRMYETWNHTDPERPPDYGYLVAALVHVGLAHYKRTLPDPAQGGDA